MFCNKTLLFGSLFPVFLMDHNAFIQGQVELLDLENECAMIPAE
jgi:hypothetical protein